MVPQMTEWWSNPEADDSFLQFRERSVRDGAWLSLATIVIVLAYVLVSWEGAHRLLIIGLLAGALVSTYVVSKLPAAAIVPGPPPTSRSSPPSSARTAARAACSARSSSCR